MRDKKEWKTKSLEWIHKVREEIDEEISRQGLTPAQWIRNRGKIEVESLCKKLGLQNYAIVRERVKPGINMNEPIETRGQEVGSR